ncbi:DUF4350 domain-containing protein [Pseudomonas sp. ZM23]|uniref:DUF4350 domain-containing protein n=1 Tax=Pseudomonas triclosanedens TaxID=2961893 RepID=A0ABY6ZV43_9PSED|nr:DUF4350 domain-containing protein [Pseudomonas triclosanedens]MCP8463157.1 DUF4350 domain-containing protein [Pseudomonas triclosanedens]MCP8469784.1 DUF4350 domain-containing protein [Pseudomonas triclosanedens]MCP8473958.1 DUF4350 domain-containing protein [Pseudomonas triclosanedens]WAI48643.1 DUF4350 domain-containing protein [Pseudomonas triclosanedens]
MKRPYVALITAAVLLMLGAVGYYLYTHLKPYPETVELGPSPEVRANAYLAAETYLRGRGLKVSTAKGLEGLDRLPSEGQTLILLGSRENLTPAQSSRLLDWASRGGRLIVTAERLWDEDQGKSGDLLLDRLGVQQFLTEDLDKDQEKDGPPAKDAGADEASHTDTEEPTEPLEESSGNAEEDDPYPLLTKLYLENERAPAYIDFDTDYHLFDSKNLAYAWANSSDSTHLLQLQHGKGLVTVLTDNWIWQNDQLSDYDNAWLLWYLTQDSAVTLVYRADGESLATLLGRYFPHALVALALLIALTLWRQGLRQGPLQSSPVPGRRQLEEHLRAGADFVLRQRGQIALLQGLQRDILRRARQRQPGFERLPVAEQWQTLGRMTRLPVTAISQAMRPYSQQRMAIAEFTRQVANLQSLRNAL